MRSQFPIWLRLELRVLFAGSVGPLTTTHVSSAVLWLGGQGS